MPSMHVRAHLSRSLDYKALLVSIDDNLSSEVLQPQESQVAVLRRKGSSGGTSDGSAERSSPPQSGGTALKRHDERCYADPTWA